MNIPHLEQDIHGTSTWGPAGPFGRPRNQTALAGGPSADVRRRPSAHRTSWKCDGAAGIRAPMPAQGMAHFFQSTPRRPDANEAPPSERDFPTPAAPSSTNAKFGTICCRVSIPPAASRRGCWRGPDSGNRTGGRSSPSCAGSRRMGSRPPVSQLPMAGNTSSGVP